MKRFNKDASLSKLDNRNNNKTKRISIIICSILLIGAIIYFSFARFESNKTYSLINGNVASKGIKISDKLLSLKSSGETDLEFDGVDILGVNGTEDNNLRYIGYNPSNFIYYNCTTTNPNEMNDETCEKWNIVGLFNNIEDEYGNKESRVKITSDLYRYYSFDSSETSVNKGYGINQWGPSDNYEGSDIMRELNTDYLGNVTVGTDGKWYDSYSNSKQAESLRALNSSAQEMIQTVKWNTGAANQDLDSWTTVNMYGWERSNNTGKICTTGTLCNDNATRTTSWTGKVGLLYASDYGYSINFKEETTCINASLNVWDGKDYRCNYKSWIYNYLGAHATLTPIAHSERSDSIVVIYGTTRLDQTGEYGGNVSGNVAANGFGIRATLYLKKNIYVVDGDGSYYNPYKLTM